MIPKGIVFVGRFGVKHGIDFNHFNFDVKVGNIGMDFNGYRWIL